MSKDRAGDGWGGEGEEGGAKLLEVGEEGAGEG